jgi:hypothetical protein
MTLQEKDIIHLAKGFSDRTIANGRINFGLRRTNLLKATVHWVHDFRRISREPTLDSINNVQEYREAIEIARQRASTRKHNADESDTLSKAADPGKLKKQKDWQPWSRAFANQLSTIPGQDGVALNYVIREYDDPDYTGEDDPDCDFEQLAVMCAPHSGPIFKADTRKVHQILHGHVQGEIAGTWIKPKEKKRDRRVDFKALTSHYGGDGNKSIRIKEAEVLRTTLHYKSQRAMSFDTFLTNMQKMFTGFIDNGELVDEAQKCRVLFQKVQCPALATVKMMTSWSFRLIQ